MCKNGRRQFDFGLWLKCYSWQLNIFCTYKSTISVLEKIIEAYTETLKMYFHQYFQELIKIHGRRNGKIKCHGTWVRKHCTNNRAAAYKLTKTKQYKVCTCKPQVFNTQICFAHSLWQPKHFPRSVCYHINMQRGPQMQKGFKCIPHLSVARILQHTGLFSGL